MNTANGPSGQPLTALLEGLENRAVWFTRGFFAKKLDEHAPGTLFEVATTARGTYIEIMVFIANLIDKQDLHNKAKEWARELESALEAEGLPSVVYLHTYTPPVRRIGK